MWRGGCWAKIFLRNDRARKESVSECVCVCVCSEIERQRAREIGAQTAGGFISASSQSKEVSKRSGTLRSREDVKICFDTIHAGAPRLLERRCRRTANDNNGD